jgi:hypothetical protein
VPSVVAALLLLIALGDHPYGYYTFLRWVACGAAVLVAWVAWNSTRQWATWLFVSIAILFNPLAPVYLHRSTWRPIDVLCAVALVCSLAIERDSAVTATSHPVERV